MAAAAAASVLALVVVIVVVACNGPSAAKHGPSGQPTTSASGRQSSSRSPAPSPSGSAHHRRRHHQQSGPGKRRTVAAFSGTGAAKTRHFLVLGTGDWILGWSYHCPAPASFAVSEDGGTDINGVQVSKHGTGGQGQTKVFGDTGHHYLTVTSTCSWKLTVTGRW